VIDDEVQLVSLFKESLRKEGFNVFPFTDAELALEYFKETTDRHNLIITDLRIPGMYGTDLAKKIRHINNKITIFNDGF
jgi:DNA-binding response OmpR family regulator